MQRAGIVALFATSACFAEPPAGPSESTAHSSASQDRDDAASSSTSEGGGESSGTHTDADTTAGIGEATSSDADTSSGGLGSCGDGVVSGDELCDDANDTPADGCTACAPSLSIVWQRTFGSAAPVEGASAISVRDGSIAVGGALAGAGDDTDLWLEILDEAGESAGRLLIDGDADAEDRVVDVRYDGAGTLWTTGVRDDGGFPQLQMDTRAISPALEVTWSTTIGFDAMPDIPAGLGLLGDGAVVGAVIGPSFATNAWFGHYDAAGAVDDSQVCDCGGSGAVVDLDTSETGVRGILVDGSGRELWGWAGGLSDGPPWQVPLDVTEPGVVLDVAPAGDTVVCGAVAGGNDVKLWLARFDASGDLLWSSTQDVGDGDQSCAGVVMAAETTLVVGSIREDEQTAVGVVARFDNGTGEPLLVRELVIEASADTRITAIDLRGDVPYVAGTYAVDALDDDAFVARLVP